MSVRKKDGENLATNSAKCQGITYLQQDPDTRAETSNRPGNEEQKKDPDDRVDNVLGHGESDGKKEDIEANLFYDGFRSSSLRDHWLLSFSDRRRPQSRLLDSQ